MFGWNARIAGFFRERKERFEEKRVNLRIFDEITNGDY